MPIQTQVFCCAALGGVLFGYDTAVVNGALFQIQSHYDIDTNSVTSGLIVSLGIVGAFFGAMLGGFIGSIFGRRRSLMTADVLFIAGSTILCVAPSLQWIFVGRVVVGLGIGISSMLVPIYLAEVSEPASRGSVIALNSVCLCGSQFVAACVCGILVHFADSSYGWRIMFGLGAVPAMIQLIATVFFLPESPRWLQVNGREEEAKSIAQEFGMSIADHHDETVGWTDSISQVVHGRLRSRLLLGCGLQALQQFSGINTVMYYSADILKNVGFSGDETPVLLSIPLAAINAGFTLIAIFYADSLGRRKLLLMSSCGCLCATVAMAITGCLQSSSTIPTDICGWSFLVLLGVYLCFFAPGLGAMPWLVMSEIFPTPLRSIASGMATMSNWGSNAVVSQCFPLLVGGIGIGPTFGIVCGIEVIGLIAIRRYVPETMKMSLEEIDAFFDEKETNQRLIS